MTSVDVQGLPTEYVSQLITKSIDEVDESHKRGIKSVHIDKKTLLQEAERLVALVKGRKDILIGTHNIFPKIEILEVYENFKDAVDQSEYEDDFEEESKALSRVNTSRSEK